MKIFSTILLLLSSLNSFSKDHAWYSDFISPVTTDAKYITMGGLAATLMVYSNKSHRTYRKRDSLDQAKPFKDYGIVGDIMGRGLLNATYAIGFLAHGYFAENDNSLRSGEHMAKASLYATSLVMVTKFLVSERRPGYPDDDDSFPSGHAAGSFAFASVVAARHGWYWGGAAYSVASFISISRINDDFHYLHDVVAGATIGAAFGWGTYYNYKSGKPYFLAPILVDDGGGLNISWSY
ncbi:phosphatase PAP2 family protein [Halobacteriovorax sp. JY17]|uniref:phosphatase PAP2 family protein n=1 Tax=Halobacteriovorax sp. JY17 TaxID=2014617 RepID=UPI0025B7D910|nr:phosphatase PAP2 family protein [Halobacteriovorax sp. JY17]